MSIGDNGSESMCVSFNQQFEHPDFANVIVKRRTGNKADCKRT